jgi:hypothetical protein
MAENTDNADVDDVDVPDEDVQALLEAAHAVLAAEDDKAFAAREAAVLADFIRCRNEMVRIMARAWNLVQLRDGKLSAHSRQRHEHLAQEIRALVEMLEGRTSAA